MGSNTQFFRGSPNISSLETSEAHFFILAYGTCARGTCVHNTSSSQNRAVLPKLNQIKIVFSFAAN